MQTPPSTAGDVGLGTAFERWAIYERLNRWFGRRPPRTALEGPVDGMAGMPGLHLLPLARRGTRVTVVLSCEAARERVRTIYRRAGLADRLRLRQTLPDETAELVLAFNLASADTEWRSMVGDLANRSHRHFLLFATHPRSYGVGIRRAIRRFEKGPPRTELFDHEATDPQEVRRQLALHGDLLAEAFVDCPWWPDLFVDAGQTLWAASRARFVDSQPSSAPTRYDFDPDTFPFATDDVPPVIRAALARHPHFDGRADVVAGWFAHHRAYLVDRSNMDLPRSAE